jgi:amidase
LVAAGEVDMAIGGDQGGSIRIPASWCGVVGLKPTYGLVPYTGVFPIELTLDHTGPIARSTSDVALLLEAVAGPDGLDPRQSAGLHGQAYSQALTGDVRGLRLGILQEGFGHEDLSERDVDEAVTNAARSFEGLGAHVETVSIPWHLDGQHVWSAIAVEGATMLMVAGNSMGTNWKGHYYAKAQNLARTLKAAYDEALSRFDLLVMPTLPMKATEIPAPDCSREEYTDRALEMIPNTCPFDVTGHPAITIPCGVSEGLPIGMMLVGRTGDDATVLRAADAYERNASA